jgi:hypothetical protein
MEEDSWENTSDSDDISIWIVLISSCKSIMKMGELIQWMMTMIENQWNL